jgi:hypothetical protein
LATVEGLEWGGTQGIKIQKGKIFSPYTLNFRLRQYVTFLFALSVAIINLTFKAFQRAF